MMARTWHGRVPSTKADAYFGRLYNARTNALISLTN